MTDISQRPQEIPDLTIPHAVTPFFLPTAPVRGRLIRLGALAHTLLSRHETLPPEILTLGGEALGLIAAMATALKFEGSLSLQIKGDGPCSLFLADCTDKGALRFTACMKENFNPEKDILPKNPEEIFGKGYLAFTIDQGPDMERHQGIVTIEGESLAKMAEHYFETSEQHKCILRLFATQKAGVWHAGALILEHIAGSGGHADNDDFSPYHQDLWETAQSFAHTLKEEEIFSPELSSTTLLQRLFGTLDVQIAASRPLSFGCGCHRAKFSRILESFSESDLDHMAEDGIISMNCHFCNVTYQFQRDKLGAPPHE